MRVYHIEIRSATSDRKLSKMGLGTNWDFLLRAISSLESGQLPALVQWPRVVRVVWK